MTPDDTKPTPPDVIVYAANNPAHNTMPVSDYDGPTLHFTGSQITPPAPTPTLPEELRDDVAQALGVFFEQPDDAKHAEERVLGAVARHWPRPTPVTADARELDGRVLVSVLSHPEYWTEDEEKRIAAVLAPVLRERDDLRAEVEAIEEWKKQHGDPAKDIADLRADNHRLDAEIGVLEGQLAAAQAQAREAMEDTKRLDWLDAMFVDYDAWETFAARSPETLDLRAAIDAARREGGAP